MTRATYGRKGLFGLNGFRGVRVHNDREAWKKTSDMAAGAGSWQFTFEP